jgi:hypothetical protein
VIVEQSNSIMNEVSRALLGKRDVIEKALMAIYAGGHILLEDVPGTGKTTLALALSRALGLDFKRVQFTPDTLPSDITGFTMFDRDAGTFRFVWGAVNCNMLLGDEINRTSAKTQSALLEVMEERAVTIDGQTHQVPRPFVCIATENPVGSAGTQPLPDSQLDRFMVRLSVGYPSRQDQIVFEITIASAASMLISLMMVFLAQPLFFRFGHMEALRLSVGLFALLGCGTMATLSSSNPISNWLMSIAGANPDPAVLGCLCAGIAVLALALCAISCTVSTKVYRVHDL